MKSQHWKQKSIDAVTSVLNISDRFYAKKIGVNFGRNYEEVRENMEIKEEFMRGKKNLDYLKAQSSGSESKSKSKKSQKKDTENTLDIQQ